MRTKKRYHGPVIDCSAALHIDNIDTFEGDRGDGQFVAKETGGCVGASDTDETST